LLARAQPPSAAQPPAQGFEEIVARRVAFLRDYQNEAYAARYRALVLRAREAERARTPVHEAFALAVARNLFKLMAVKDEYEVARLYADGAFQEQLKAAFEGDLRLEFHLAPPLFARRDPQSGLPIKSTFGPRMMGLFRMLAPLKALRGTPLDIFGYTQERREERRLLRDYEALLEELIAALDADTHAAIVALAEIPQMIRGFGHVKARHVTAARAQEAALLAQLRAGPAAVKAAAE
jgi:indolepyruvate ferredoxin oxidoreductase